MSEEREMRKTSYSEVQSFLQCGRQHYYSYGLKIRGKYISEALERGIMGHAALETYYRERMAGTTHAAAASAAMGTLSVVGQATEAYAGINLVFEVAGLLRLYFEHYANDPIEVLAVETEYSVGILEDYELPVRIDVILRNTQTGIVTAWDHKFVKDFYDDKKARLNPQLRLYLVGLRTKGIVVDELGFNQIRHRNTIDNKANPSQRFVRMPVPVTTSSAKRTIEEHLMAANRIKAWRDMGLEKWGDKVLRNPSACGMCSFTELCAQELEGEPVEGLIEYEYVKKTPRSEMTS